MGNISYEVLIKVQMSYPGSAPDLSFFVGLDLARASQNAHLELSFDTFTW